MTLKGTLVPDAFGDVAASIVRAYNDARLSKAALHGAEQMLVEALGRAEDKVAFLEQLVAEAETVGLPAGGREQLLRTAYTLLRDEGALLGAIGHVLRASRGET